VLARRPRAVVATAHEIVRRSAWSRGQGVGRGV